MKLLKELSEAAAVPGSEEAIRKIIKRELKGKVKSLKEDAMGNLIAYKPAAKKGADRLMLSAHMDEIGFYVSKIDEKGFLRVQNVGGFDPRNLFARRVKVHTKSKVLPGLMNPGITPLHTSRPEERKRIPTISDLFIDLGMSAKAVKSKVKVGDMVTLDQKFSEIGDLVSGKALDNRVSVWLGIKIMQKLKKSKYNLYCAFTVQEEVGLRGAQTAAFGIEPDLAIALDTTLGDAPHGVPSHRQVSKLGDGVCIKVMDSSVICDKRLVTALTNLAKKKKIKHQMEVLPAGGTDTGAIQRSRAGVRSVALSVPTRNIHTVTECIDPKDLNATLKLLEAYLKA